MTRRGGSARPTYGCCGACSNRECRYCRGFSKADLLLPKRASAHHDASTSPQVLPVLTKADLLLPEDLAASHAVVSAQLAEAAPAGTGVRAPPLMLSAHFLTGVANLWRVLLRTLAEIERAEFGAEEGRRRREGLEGAHSVDEDESDVARPPHGAAEMHQEMHAR